MLSLAVGVTDQTLDVRFVDDEGLPATGLVAATMPAVKMSKGTGADITISLVDLALATSTHTDGGVKERGEGVYRLDLPDTAASTAGIVTLRSEATGKRLIVAPIQVGLQDALESALEDAVSEFETAPPISLVVGSVLPRTFSQDIEAFIGEEAEHTLVVTTNRGVAVDLSSIAAMTLILETKGNDKTVIQTVLDAALDRTDDVDGIVRWTNNAAATLSARTLRYVLKNDSGNVRILRGDFKVTYEPGGA